MKQQLRKALKGLLILGLLVSPVLVWTQRHTIYDWWRLRDYSPSSRIVALADATTMNGYGRKLFYVNRPQIDNQTAFNEHCQGSEQSIVLGCYISGRGIFIYDVNDERLKGVHEVTAAHEMLHAAYERLGGKEKARVDKLLEDFFDELDNPRIKKIVESYRTKDPSVVTNELHSIIGTEVRTLSPELEEYYKKHFSDRLRVVGFSEQYDQAFSERQNKVESYDAELANLKKQIEETENTLTQNESSLDAERTHLDQLLASGQISAYNVGIPGFNAQVRSYNSLFTHTKRLIEQYNTIVAERNAIALEEQTLIKALDSRVTPQPEQ